ncbi:MAG TPA: hypothetical protein VEH80_05205 [Candidatus Bathyarchaeia archaeon]|nr:hypothetical protein [Candidatus Bathyarchaeia archaeon]
MTPRQKAAAIATQFEGRCTCAMMDGGVDCPWCQVYYDVLQGYPIVPPAPRAPASAITMARTA